MAALWIAHVTVTNTEAYGKYAELAGPAIAKHGGEFIARAARYVQLEGKERPRNVVARFPTLEAAVELLQGKELPQTIFLPIPQVKAADLKAGENYFPDLPKSFNTGTGYAECFAPFTPDELLAQSPDNT